MDETLVDRMMFARSQCLVDDMCRRIVELVEIARDGGNFGPPDARFLVEVIEGCRTRGG